MHLHKFFMSTTFHMSWSTSACFSHDHTIVQIFIFLPVHLWVCYRSELSRVRVYIYIYMCCMQCIFFSFSFSIFKLWPIVANCGFLVSVRHVFFCVCIYVELLLLLPLFCFVYCFLSLAVCCFFISQSSFASHLWAFVVYTVCPTISVGRCSQMAEQNEAKH